jgi:hypothetical protein
VSDLFRHELSPKENAPKALVVTLSLRGRGNREVGIRICLSWIPVQDSC